MITNNNKITSLIINTNAKKLLFNRNNKKAETIKLNTKNNNKNTVFRANTTRIKRKSKKVENKLNNKIKSNIINKETGV
jgi:hypothetical protein